MKVAIYSLIGIIFLILLFIIFSFTGEIYTNENFQENDLEEFDINLRSFFPNSPYGWIYKDGRTYIRVLAVEDIYETSKQTTVILGGQEDDSSIKTLSRSKDFVVKYEITNDEIIEKMSGITINNYFKQSTLLKKPIRLEETWNSNWILNDDTEILVEAKIVEIENDGEKIIIEYKGNKETFFETRVFELGKGITSYSRKEDFEGTKYNVFYDLEICEVTKEFGLEEYFMYINAKLDNVIEKNEILKSDDIKYDKSGDEIEIKNVIKHFNDGWIEFVNNGNEGVFNFLITDGNAYNIISSFNRHGMKQEFLKMNIDKIVIEEDIANVYVYEEIKKEYKGSEEILKYDWIYELNYINGKWLIKGYTKNNP